MKVVLASQSPRRRELMRRLGFDYITATADVNEDNNNRVVPREYARETALKKRKLLCPSIPIRLSSRRIRSSRWTREFSGNPEVMRRRKRCSRY